MKHHFFLFNRAVKYEYCSQVLLVFASEYITEHEYIAKNLDVTMKAVKDNMVLSLSRLTTLADFVVKLNVGTLSTGVKRLVRRRRPI